MPNRLAMTLRPRVYRAPNIHGGQAKYISNIIMESYIEEIIIALISAGVPSLVTAIFSIINHRQNKMHSAKQSILQMIMEDQFNYEQFRKLPINQSRIAYEYKVYTKNGGNHDVTERFEEYNEWLDGIERSIDPHKSSHSS